MLTRGYGLYSGLIPVRGYGATEEPVFDNICMVDEQTSIFKMFQENL